MTMSEPTRTYEQMEYKLNQRGIQVGMLKTARKDLTRQVVELTEKYETLQVAHNTVMDELVAARRQAEMPYKQAWNEGLRHGQNNPNAYTKGWKDGNLHGKAQCNHHPEAMTRQDLNKFIIERENISLELGIEEGERRLHGIGAVAYQKGFIKGKEAGRDEGGTFDEGNEAGYADGLAEGKREADSLRYAEGWGDGRKRGVEDGRKRAVTDWLQHFILYMQDNGQSLAVCNLSQLEDMREAASKIREIVDAGEDTSAHLDDIENILTGLESP
jgi:flagellar biosynthesis/type III secretory pathway protein FliH